MRHGRWVFSLGVQGKQEGGANVEGEGETVSLAGQRLAKGHALRGQGRLLLTHCRSSHFQLYLNHEFSLGSQKKTHVTAFTFMCEWSPSEVKSTYTAYNFVGIFLSSPISEKILPETILRSL